MARITEDAAEAFMRTRPFSRGNTVVEVVKAADRTVVTMILWGNPIARRTKRAGGETLEVCTQGHETRTTKDRLNAIDGVSVEQRDFDWYLNNRRWDDTSNWTEVRSGGAG